MMNIFLLPGWATSPNIIRPLSQLLEKDIETHVQNAHDFLTSKRVIELINRDKGKTVLVGWSMGGMIALDIASYAPHWVSALILIGTPLKFCSAPDYRYGCPRERLAKLAMKLRIDPEATMSDFFCSSASPKKPSCDDLTLRIGCALEIGINSLLDGLVYLEKEDFRPNVKKIKCPLLVMHGRKDTIVQWPIGKLIANQVPTAQWNLIPNIGHDLPLQLPKLVSNRILEFIHSVNT